jgi:hypothetical protein
MQRRVAYSWSTQEGMDELMIQFGYIYIPVDPSTNITWWPFSLGVASGEKTFY